MAFNIVGKTTYIPKWNGNRETDKPISIELKYLDQEDYWSTMEVLKKMPTLTEGQKESGEKIQVKPSLMIEISSKLTPVFEKSIGKIEGLTIDNKPISPGFIAQHPMLSGLSTELMLELINRSTVTINDKKK